MSGPHPSDTGARGPEDRGLWPLHDPAAGYTLDWALVSDRVMGGVSEGRLSRAQMGGRAALRLQGAVRLDNNGGFLQMAADLAPGGGLPGGGLLDARGFGGLRLVLCGNGARYGVHLRSADLARPWQSYRAQLAPGPDWAAYDLPFSAFRPHRTDAPMRLARLRRIGIVAIGAAFEADVALAGLWLWPGRSSGVEGIAS